MQPTPDEVSAFLAQPETLYALSPIAKALYGALAELERRAPDRAASAEWQTIKSHCMRAVERPDLLIERAQGRLRLTDAQRAAMRAQEADVRISGRVADYTILPDAVKFVLDDAEIRSPATGVTLLSRDDHRSLLLLAASNRFFLSSAAAGASAAERSRTFNAH